jgi:hypothetical protein
MKLPSFHIIGLVLSHSSLGIASASSSPSKRNLGRKSCNTRVNNTKKKLLQCVTLEGVREHQAALQAIADDNNGTRALGSSGYQASVDYIVDQLEASGYNATLQQFQTIVWKIVGPSTLEQINPPNPFTYVENVDYGLLSYSSSGEVSALVEAVDLALDNPISSTSGCEEADFDSFTAGT